MSNDRIKTFTRTYLNSLRPASQRYEVRDAATSNLYVVVHPTGATSYVWRGMLEGRYRKFTLGRTNIHPLEEARAWAAKITHGRDYGINVLAEEAKLADEKAKVASRTCDWLFEQYMEYEGNRQKAAKEKWRIYRREVQPTLGSRPVASITHADLAAITRARAKDAGPTSNSIQRLVRRFFNWSVTHGRDISELTESPAKNLPKFAPDGIRDRDLKDWEIQILFQVFRESDSRFIEPLTFSLYTGARRGEVFGLLWSELDLDNGDWLIPGSRTKNGMDHLLPLPIEMVSMLRRRRLSESSTLVWPSSRTPTLPMSGFSKITAQLNGLTARAGSRAGRTFRRWTIHDLRRTLVTGMNALRAPDDSALIPEHVVERVVNHKPPRMSSIYNRYSYYAEKKQALRHWADHLQNLSDGQRRPS